MSYIKTLLICVMTVVVSLLAAQPMLVYAEEDAVLSVPDKVDSGSCFDISLTFYSEESIGWFETNLLYDNKLLEYVSGDANGGEGNLHLRCFPDTVQNSFSVTLRFSARKEGTAVLSLANCSVFSPDGMLISTPTASAAVNISASSDLSLPADDSSEDSSITESVPDSNTRECFLKSLSLSEGELAPAFSPDIFDYTVKLKSGVNKVEVVGELGSVNDFIWFECSSWLSETEDPKQIIVNIPDEEVKLKITVKDSENDPTVTNIYRIMFVPEAVSDSSSEQEEDMSSVTTTASQSAAVTTAPEEIVPDGTSVTTTKAPTVKEPSGMEELRDKLMPWLLVVLLVLIIALVLVIYWIRSRTDRKRRRIKSSGGRK